MKEIGVIHAYFTYEILCDLKEIHLGDEGRSWIDYVNKNEDLL